MLIHNESQDAVASMTTAAKTKLDASKPSLAQMPDRSLTSIDHIKNTVSSDFADTYGAVQTPGLRKVYSRGQVRKSNLNRKKNESQGELTTEKLSFPDRTSMIKNQIATE